MHAEVFRDLNYDEPRKPMPKITRVRVCQKCGISEGDWHIPGTVLDARGMCGQCATEWDSLREREGERGLIEAWAKRAGDRFRERKAAIAAARAAKAA